MSIPVNIRFVGNLNDFLPVRQQGQWVAVSCPATATVKDVLEAAGVPHVEVNGILLNGHAVDFTGRLRAGDQVEAFPIGFATTRPLLKPWPPQPAFILDVHLGKLARLLRLLGLDVRYERYYADEQIAALSAAENRLVLTRDVPLLKRKNLPGGYWLRSQQPEEQLVEVLLRFDLLAHLRPFSRCTVCNGLLTEVPKEHVQHQLEPLTRENFHEFCQCTACGKVYWKGSHYERMQDFIDGLPARLKAAENGQ